MRIVLGVRGVVSRCGWHEMETTFWTGLDVNREALWSKSGGYLDEDRRQHTTAL